MSLLSGRKSYLPLEENKPYKVILTGWEEHINTDEATKEQRPGFVMFKWQLLSDNRIVNDSRSFPVGTDVLATSLLQQFNDASMNAMEQEDLFQTCVDSKHEFDMWVERVASQTSVDTFTNYLFRAPKPKTTQPNPQTPNTPQSNGVEGFH
jgi:hypothetical protein